MLQHQPRIEIRRLDFDADQGRFAASASAALPESPAAGYFSDVSKLTRALALDWEIKMSPDLARHLLEMSARDIPPTQTGAEEVLNRLGADAVLIVEEGQLVSRGELKHQVLRVNGQPMEWPWF